MKISSKQPWVLIREWWKPAPCRFKRMEKELNKTMAFDELNRTISRNSLKLTLQPIRSRPENRGHLRSSTILNQKRSTDSSRRKDLLAKVVANGMSFTKRPSSTILLPKIKPRSRISSASTNFSSERTVVLQRFKLSDLPELGKDCLPISTYSSVGWSSSQTSQRSESIHGTKSVLTLNTPLFYKSSRSREEKFHEPTHCEDEPALSPKMAPRLKFDPNPYANQPRDFRKHRL